MRGNHISEAGKYEIGIPKPRIWSKEYYVDAVGENVAARKERIANRLKEDREGDRLNTSDPDAPFKGWTSN